MKRTKERFGKLEGYNKEGLSGCKVFDGEDLEYQDRFKLQQTQQRSWVEQQQFEKDSKTTEEKNEERLHAEQTLSINRMRAMMEAEHHNKIKEMNKMTMEYNKQLAQEKKDREAKNKYDNTMMDVFSIEEAERTRSTVYSKLREEINQTKNSIA
jgi:hypothetical protein